MVPRWGPSPIQASLDWHWLRPLRCGPVRLLRRRLPLTPVLAQANQYRWGYSPPGSGWVWALAVLGWVPVAAREWGLLLVVGVALPRASPDQCCWRQAQPRAKQSPVLRGARGPDLRGWERAEGAVVVSPKGQGGLPVLLGRWAMPLAGHRLGCCCGCLAWPGPPLWAGVAGAQWHQTRAHNDRSAPSPRKYAVDPEPP